MDGFDGQFELVLYPADVELAFRKFSKEMLVSKLRWEYELHFMSNAADVATEKGVWVWALKK